MKLEAKLSIIDHFKDIEDPRVERTKAHFLYTIKTVCSIF